MMKKIFLLAMMASMVWAQDLSGVRICIDPGHSGHEGDDRFMEATGFWESESNLTKGLELRAILQGLGAEVAITRTGNNNTTDDLGLSERAAVANNFNADYFNSNHSNGFNGTANYAMVIYNGTTNSPTFPLARTMANIMAPLIHDVNHTTSDVSIGDLTLNPTWTNGYGVLVPANMPATISEGSFHDYIPESWRLMNLDYRKHEAMAMARSYLEYFGQPGFTVGAVAGLVKDPENVVSYYSIGSLQDQWLPVNNIEVSVEPGGRRYYGGENNNGYFKVDSLDPGTYEVIVSASGFATDTSTVTVLANQTTMSNFMLVNTAPPIVIEFHPEEGDTTWPVWEIPFFDFSKAMDRTSLENAFSIEPSVAGTFYLSADLKRMAWILADSLEFLTDYTITIAGTATDVAGHPLDGNQDGTGGDDFTVSFRTGSRDFFPPVIEETYPDSNAELVDLRPVFNIAWDEEIQFDNEANSRVVLQRIYDLQIQETTLEHYVINDKSLLVLYATNDLLDNEQYRVSILPGFSDMLGNSQNSETTIEFTTSNYDYAVTNIDNFEAGVGN
ncbi:MAG: Ig-like domain-containing protein [Candidatus Marinimicrobia bacterium]|nr:Ig-like domain-containing protein [Candidatus Neomarinimicrobiota bacterium]